jgi:hypothetical protein
MNLARISKKVPHVDHRQTLPALHKQKLNEYSKQRLTLPDKEKLLGQLITQYNSDDCAVDRFDLYAKVCKLQDDVKKLRSNYYENEYMIHAAPYLRAYHEEIEKSKNKQLEIEKKHKDELEAKINESKIDEIVIKDSEVLDESDGETDGETDNEIKVPSKKVSDFTKYIKKEEITNKGKIYKEFTSKCLSGNYSLYSPNKEETDSFKLACSCGGKRVVIPREAIASCTSCGNTVNYVDSTGPMEYRPEVEILSQFSYKRINHFKEWLTQLQAKETALPSEKVINVLLLELKKERVNDIEKITPTRIKGYLKKLRLIKQYEHIPAIIDKLCGIPPPVISRKLENKLIALFEEAQPPFEKHCPKDRSNFLSYSYTLHKMCELLGEDQLIPCFPLLKSREKLYFQDKLWKLICLENRWEFHASL